MRIGLRERRLPHTAFLLGVLVVVVTPVRHCFLEELAMDSRCVRLADDAEGLPSHQYGHA